MKKIKDKCDESIKRLDANQLVEVEEFNDKQKEVDGSLQPHHHQAVPGSWWSRWNARHGRHARGNARSRWSSKWCRWSWTNHRRESLGGSLRALMMRAAAEGTTDTVACLFWILSSTVTLRPFHSAVFLAMSSPIFLGDRPRGPTLGAREEVAPTSPPTARR